MSYDRMTGIVAAGLVLLASSACTQSGAAAATGVARVLVSAQDGAAAIARVTVTVSRGDGPDFTPIAADLTSSGTDWTGRITAIPVGPGRRFDAVAFDAGGSKLYSGSASTDIVADAAAIVTILFQAEQPGLMNSFPVIDSLTASRDQVAANAAVQLAVTAHDPDGDKLGYGWTAKCGGFDDASKANPIWTAPSALGPCEITITVADDRGAATTATLVLNVVSTGNAVVTVSINAWPIIAGMTGSVTLGATMHGAAAVVAADPDGDPLTYAWSTTCTGLVFDLSPPYGVTLAQFTMPGPSSSCDVTVIVSDGRGGNTQVTLTLPPNVLTSLCNGVTCLKGQTCDPSDGVCKPTDLCAGVTCPPATDLCHIAGTCNAVTGVCGAETLKPCPAGDACDLTTGNCVAANRCAGVICQPATDLCHVAGTCDPATGVCSAQTAKTCPEGQQCNVATGQCQGTSPVPVLQVARDLQISPPAGMAMDTSGNAYLAAAINSLAPIDFDGHKVASNGDFDVFLAKYDTTGHATWAVNYGDASPQLATGAAVTQDGTVAAIGNFIGNMTFGTTTISNASSVSIDFLAAVKSADGSGLWAKQFNDGSNGVLKAVAANANDGSTHGNRIAVCGLANAAATDLVSSGAPYAGPFNNIIIGAFTSSGTRLWANEFGTASFNAECDTLAVDDNGDVYAAGKFDGPTLAFGGATSPLTGPGNTNRKFVWVAKFDGATGAGIQSVAYGNSVGQASANSIAFNAALGKVVVAGGFNSALPFGSTTLTSAGGTDAFVAELDPAAALAPTWAVRMGGTAADAANGVAVTSYGDVLVTGLFNKTTVGNTSPSAGVGLTAAGTGTAADVFLLELGGATGATQFAAGYGDPVTQTGDALAVNRFGANQFVLTGTLNGSIPFPAPAGTVTATGTTDVFLLVGPIQ
jgi:hypothetical protein